jgi:flavorubredoxin
MSKVLIIYHSQSGNTEAMAKAVSEGARSAGATVTLKKAATAVAEDLMNCGVVVFGTPNFFSYEAGMIKDFFDRTYFALKGKVDGKPYAVFGSYGGGGEMALASLCKLCDSTGLKKAADSIGAQRAPSAEAVEKCKALGAKMALI